MTTGAEAREHRKAIGRLLGRTITTAEMAQLLGLASKERVKDYESRAPTGPVAAALRLMLALATVRVYIADEMVAHAMVLPPGGYPHRKHPTLMQVVDEALATERNGLRE